MIRAKMNETHVNVGHTGRNIQRRYIRQTRTHGATANLRGDFFSPRRNDYVATPAAVTRARRFSSAAVGPASSPLAGSGRVRTSTDFPAAPSAAPD